MNIEIRRRLDKVNAKPFRKRQGSRFSLFDPPTVRYCGTSSGALRSQPVVTG
ncbi:MAG TPA: hypothetical protein VKV15_08515 [Bryobacteraceae bacterium]|nr:hypothetical protein [Bryobacteraceae bacterium]